MVLRGTFGLLLTRNGGSDWDWLCEAGMGYQDLEPPFTVLAGGRILLALPNGVGVSDPNGCDFGRADGIDARVVDVSRVVARPREAVALSVDETSSRVWRSTNGGLRFEPAGAALEDFVATTLDVAPVDAKRLYVSGVTADGRPLLLRSFDAGQTFAASELPATSSVRRPFIAAVGPDDDRVFVRLDGLPGTLLESSDGGVSFRQVLELRVPVQGFALSPDGSSVLVTNSFDGSYRADLDTLEFERIACRGPSCLSWTAQGLFGCGTNSTDGFVLGASSDDGASFERVVDLSCVRGPLACDPDSSIGATCESAWPAIQLQIGAERCAPPPAPTPLDCEKETAGDGGAAGESAVEAGGTSGEGTVSDAGTAGSAVESPLFPRAAPGGCSCELPGGQRSAPPQPAGLLAAVWMILIARRATSGARDRPQQHDPGPGRRPSQYPRTRARQHRFARARSRETTR